ncbi:MAG: manganese efflux pump MntP family protein [Jaaginema sp. PMC 1080.18]|nr:manganese efflux pump MntP family protein [Jaaginema sp. PMC 1080.18]
MQLITMSAIAVGLAADAFAVSLSSGFKIKHIKLNKALKIALFFGGFQAVMPFLGWWLGLSFRGMIASFDHWIAFLILAFIGGKMIYESRSDEAEKPFNPLDFYTLIILSIATSIDAFATGIGFAVLKTSIVFASTTIGLITFCLSLLGVFMGHWCGTIFQSKAEFIGGLVLVAIGSKILIEHLSVEMAF